MTFPQQQSSFDDLFGAFLYARIETCGGYPALAQPDTVRHVSGELLRTARLFEVEAIAYCLLPDQVHVLLAGLSEVAERRGALRRWKQLSGQRYRDRNGRTLWRERVAAQAIPDVLAARTAARYLVAAPVRSLLVSRVEDFRWVSSTRWTLSELTSGRIGRPDWWPDRVTSGCRSGCSSPR